MVLISRLTDIKQLLIDLEGLKSNIMLLVFKIFIVGILSCVILDLWQRSLFLFFKIAPSNWAMVGRWLVLFLKSRVWVQPNLSDQPEIRNELQIGWGFHYGIAVLYAVFYFFLFRKGIVDLALFDGVIFGIASVIVPWFLFMPAMGVGILAQKAPAPILACILALIAHTIFGGALGLFFDIFYN